ncbi:MAG: hypothetical protein L0Z73_00290 [Gammaproteobacteria bacterium]|nr:hypothetical protein [Gammaproteobacteria bacterium]
MNTLSKKLSNAFLVYLFISVSVAGCSSTGEKETGDAAQLSEAAAQAETAKASEQEAAAGKKEAAQPVHETKEEPVVEVIPSQTGKATELTVEPIAAPEPVPAEMQPQSSTAKTETTPSDQETAKESPATHAEQLSGQKAAIPVPVSTGPDHFVITAAIKDQQHPHFGKGHQMGFLVNNEPGKEIVLQRGKTYRIDVATDPMHDVYISLKEIGWGSTPYTEGVDGMYTYDGTITIKPDEKTPDLLFYSCRNHPYMGGKIHIVNPGQTAEVAKKSATDVVPAVAAQQQQVAKADVSQKLMFADLLLKSKNSEAVLKSNSSEAIALHKKAESELRSAKDNLAVGKNAEAYQQAENAIAMLKKATNLVPSESDMEHLKERNKELLVSIKGFEDSHKENYERTAKKQGKDAAVDYDKHKVEKLKASAEELSKKGDYVKANHDLEEAQRIITVALHKMLNSQTIVYDLNFETPQEEYDYELRRFKGYEELVPIAVEQNKPAEGALKLMESFVKKGQDLRDRAIKAAKDGDYPTAIAMLQDATDDVRRGLRMIGVMQ